MKTWIQLLAIGLGSLTLTATRLPCWAAGQEPVPQLARQQIQFLQAEKASRSPAHCKLDSQLLQILPQQRKKLAFSGLVALPPAVRFQEDGRFLVDLRAKVSEELVRFIEQGGGRVINRFPQYQSLRAFVPVSLMEPLALRSDVRQLRPADEAIANSGPVTSAGDTAHQAGKIRQILRVDGTGVKIGVLSDSIQYLAQSQTNGELPIVTILPGQEGSGNGEGTAMLEIIHDLAPGADLYFATAFNGIASFAQNIRDLYAAGCRVIIDDVTYFAEPPFQDGLIAQAVNDVSAGGALFFSAAGNSGNKNDNTAGTWEGDFVDGGPATFGRDGRLHDFGGATINTVNPGGSFRRLDLFWADPVGASRNDYDVYVLNAEGAVVRSSNNVQDGDDAPYESIPFLNVGERIVIVKHAGEPRYLHLSTGRAQLAISTSGATYGHNASGASNALCVAATKVRSSDLPFAGDAENPVESFSSDGPRRMFFNADGSAITPGDFTSTGGMVLQKPDFTAADGVSTSVPGFETFLGTSAAAPHAAAIAALVWSYNNALHPAEIGAILRLSALDIEAPGLDQDSGVGIVMADAALQATPIAAPRFFLGNIQLVDDNSNGRLDAQECGELAIPLQNIVASTGPTATAITATLRAITPGVLTDPTPCFYPDIPVLGSATNLTRFRVSTPPDLDCRFPVEFELSVKTGGLPPIHLPFVLSSTPPNIGATTTWNAADLPLRVPDLATVESTVTVSGITLPLAQVTASVHLKHNYNSDLQISLIGPDGTTVGLSSNNGGSSADYGTGCSAPTIFEDTAPTSIKAGQGPFAASYQPEQPLALLSGKSGEAVNGVWRLQVRDTAEGDAGVLQCWSLTLSPILCTTGNGQCLVPPRITSQPSSLLVNQGDTAQFLVTVEGTDPLIYQWYYEQTQLLPEATNATLVLTNVQLAQAGKYSVVVSNLFGTVLSSAADLQVIVRPYIVQQPQDQTITNGGAATHSVEAEGTPPLSYQWLVDDVPALPDATNATLLLTDLQPVQSGRYSVVVSNPYGTVTSRSALLLVGAPPAIEQQPPPSLKVHQGATAVLSVVGSGTAPLRFQWYWNEITLLSEATNASLILSNVQPNQAGSYRAVITSPFGNAASTETTLTVNARPQVHLILPAPDTSYTANDVIQLEATAADPDGAVLQVDFLADGRRLHTMTAAPYRFEWLDPALDTYNLAAVATDNEGLSVTSAVVRIMVNYPTKEARLVPARTTWKYLDNGAMPGANWQAVEFDDNGWLSGRAQLGFGDRDEATILRSGLDTGINPVSYYFRHSFVLTDAGSFTNLGIWLLRDDGGVVYVNGVEVFRSNMPDGPITPDTLALDIVPPSGEDIYHQIIAGDASWLRQGTNVIAAEIHQADPFDSDLSFNCFMVGYRTLSPRILDQPQNVSVMEGGTAQWNVAAAGTPPLSYQWYVNDTTPIAGATNALLEINNVQRAQTGRYSVIVSNVFGTVTSTEVLLSLLSAPQITQHPQNQTTAQGGTVGFSVTAEGTAPFSYQWYFNGSTALPDATNDVLQLPNVQPEQAGLYYVVVSNFLGTAASTEATLTVVPPPSITEHPQSQTVKAGDTAQFSVAATGEEPLLYQWFFEGTLRLPEATNAMLVLLNVQPEMAGRYVVEISNAVGLVRSDPATLIILEPPVITVHPQATAVSQGASAVFDVQAVGTPPLSYQWYYNGLPLSVGGVDATLVLTNVMPEQAGTYEVEISNAAGSLRSQPAVLTILDHPKILSGPQDALVVRGATVQLGVEAAGKQPLAYQWYYNETNALLDATNALLILTNIQPEHAGNYSVEVSNLLGVDRSLSARITVLYPPHILRHPESHAIAKASTAHFSVQAVGAAPLAYQWFFNKETALIGETNTSLTLTNVQPEQAGSYSVQVTNVDGATHSEAALLTVLIPPQITTHPRNLILTEGSTATFSVTALGSDPKTYQWLYNGNALADAVTPTLTIANVGPSQSGSYAVIVSNPAGSVTSDSAQLRVLVNSQIVHAEYSGGVVRLSFSTVSELRYTVEYTDVLDSRPWNLLPSAVKLPGSGSVLTVTDTRPHSVVRFYRIRIE